ncbi:MAG TPA: DNA repair protein RecO [Alphaproteobacteria bacterium]|jgi:DNA repair protein RecO (recombination protein O)
MEWTDHGIVLSARRHGESAVIASLLTREHGRHSGLVRGGAGSRARGIYQPGNRVAARWRGRLAEHLGSYSCELSRSTAAGVLDDALALAVLRAACAVTEAALPERHPYARVYETLDALLDKVAAGAKGLVAHYIRWELVLLAEIGYGLDLTACAATGSNDNLAYVSPKTGRAVSLSAGEPYRDRLLPLPAFLLGESPPGGSVPAGDLAAGLRLTGYFLDRHVLSGGRTPPAPRRRLEAMVAAPRSPARC